MKKNKALVISSIIILLLIVSGTVFYIFFSSPKIIKNKVTQVSNLPSKIVKLDDKVYLIEQSTFDSEKIEKKDVILEKYPREALINENYIVTYQIETEYELNKDDAFQDSNPKDEKYEIEIYQLDGETPIFKEKLDLINGDLALENVEKYNQFYLTKIDEQDSIVFSSSDYTFDKAKQYIIEDGQMVDIHKDIVKSDVPNQNRSIENKYFFFNDVIFNSMPIDNILSGLYLYNSNHLEIELDERKINENYNLVKEYPQILDEGLGAELYIFEPKEEDIDKWVNMLVEEGTNPYEAGNLILDAYDSITHQDEVIHSFDDYLKSAKRFNQER